MGSVYAERRIRFRATLREIFLQDIHNNKQHDNITDYLPPATSPPTICTFCMQNSWYIDYFGDDYYRFDHHEDTDLEVAGLEQLLGDPDQKTILDLGCGYGRHSKPLTALGYHVIGYDLSAALLKHARDQDHRVPWVRGDMQALPFHPSFDAVLSLFTTIGYFEDEAENFQVFRSISEVLRPGGRFICQLVNRDYLIRQFTPQEIHHQDELIILEERTFNPIGNRVHTQTTVMEGSTRRQYESVIRLYTLTELDLLLAAVDVSISEIYGGLDLRPFNWDTNQLVIVAEKMDYDKD